MTLHPHTLKAIVAMTLSRPGRCDVTDRYEQECITADARDIAKRQHTKVRLYGVEHDNRINAKMLSIQLKVYPDPGSISCKPFKTGVALPTAPMLTGSILWMPLLLIRAQPFDENPSLDLFSYIDFFIMAHPETWEQRTRRLLNV